MAQKAIGGGFAFDETAAMGMRLYVAMLDLRRRSLEEGQPVASLFPA